MLQHTFNDFGGYYTRSRTRSNYRTNWASLNFTGLCCSFFVWIFLIIFLVLFFLCVLSFWCPQCCFFFGFYSFLLEVLFFYCFKTCTYFIWRDLEQMYLITIEKDHNMTQGAGVSTTIFPNKPIIYFNFLTCRFPVNYNIDIITHEHKFVL